MSDSSEDLVGRPMAPATEGKADVDASSSHVELRSLSAAKVRNLPTDEGRALGEQMARFTDQAEPAARLKCPGLPPRCNSCAFRAGNHTASGSPTTQMDALKCVMEGIAFYCHEPARAGDLCSGWAMWMLAKDESNFVAVDWGFSDEPSPQSSTSPAPTMGEV